MTYDDDESGYQANFDILPTHTHSHTLHTSLGSISSISVTIDTEHLYSEGGKMDSKPFSYLSISFALMWS